MKDDDVECNVFSIVLVDGLVSSTNVAEADVADEDEFRSFPPFDGDAASESGSGDDKDSDLRSSAVVVVSNELR